MAALRPQSQNQSHYTVFISCWGSTGRASTPYSWSRGFKFMNMGLAQPVEHQPHIHEVVGSSSTWDSIFSRFCTFLHTRSEQNYPISVSAERETPIPHSLTLWYTVVLVLKSFSNTMYQFDQLSSFFYQNGQTVYQKEQMISLNINYQKPGLMLSPTKNKRLS